jgi:hypothetical protein
MNRSIFRSSTDKLREAGFCRLREWQIGKRYTFDIQCLADTEEVRKLSQVYGSSFKDKAMRISTLSRATLEMGFYQGKVVFAEPKFKLTVESRNQLRFN